MKNPYDHQFLSLLQRCDDLEFKKDFFNQLLSSGKTSLCKKIKTLSLNKDIKNKIFSLIYKNNLEEFGMDSFIYKNKIDDELALYYSKCLLEAFSDKINTYISLKQSYEFLLLNKKYTEAKKILDELDNEVGISLWSCGQRLLIEQKEHLIGENSKYFLEGFFDNENRNFITILNLLYLSFLSDDDIKFSIFKKMFKEYLDIIKNDDVKKYVLSKFSFNRQYLLDNISLVLQVDSQYSIIDLYNDLETIIPIYYYDFFSRGRGEVLLINKLGIKSKLAQNINLIYDINANQELVVYGDESINCKITELYITGDYQKVYELTQELLDRSVIAFHIACMFCKSAVRLGISDLGNVPDYIMHIWKLLKMDNQIRDQIVLLQKDLRQSWGLSYHYGLIDFLQNNNLIETEWEEYDFVSRLSYCSIDIQYLKNTNENFTTKFNDSFVSFAPNSMSYFDSKIKHKPLTQNNNVNSLRKCFLNVENLIENSEYDNAIACLEAITESNLIGNSYDKSFCYQQYIEAYLRSKDLYSAIKLIVDIYFEDNEMFLWINNIFSGRIPQKIRDEKLQSDVSCVIYEYIINPANYSRQIIAYSNYLDKNNYDTVFDAINQINVDSKKEKFFFDTVCSINLLKRDPIIKKSKKTAEEARIEILQRMYKLYGEPKYTKEIESTRTAVYIKNNLSKINKSRIYVDTEKIYFEHKDEWNWMYSKLHESLQGKGEAMACINFEHSEVSSAELDTLSSKIECPSIDNQPLQILNTLFNNMLKEFLFSQQYGLETHLSSRIRHGYCHEQLTGFLNEQHLLSTDNSQSNETLINTYWSDKITENDDLRQYVIDALSNFTKKINAKVDEVLKKWLRIQWYGRPDGLFKFADLSIKLPTVCKLYLENTLPDSVGIYREFTKMFWQYMQNILNDIKNRVDNDLYDFYSSSLTELEDDLKKCPFGAKDRNIQQLIRDCGVARSKMVTALTQFKDAFSINIGDYNDFSLDSLAHICQQICINFNNDCNNIKWSFNTDSQTLFAGKYFVSFVDLLGILLNNAINHSGFSNYQDIEIEIEAIEVGGDAKNEAIMTFKDRGVDVGNLCDNCRMFSVSVKNNLHTNINVRDLEQKIADVFVGIREDSENKIQSEGGSGLYKLCNIIQNNIDAPYYIAYDLPKQSICVSYVFLANNIVKGENDASINS